MTRCNASGVCGASGPSVGAVRTRGGGRVQGDAPGGAAETERSSWAWDIEGSSG